MPRRSSEVTRMMREAMEIERRRIAAQAAQAAELERLTIAQEELAQEREAQRERTTQDRWARLPDPFWTPRTVNEAPTGTRTQTYNFNLPVLPRFPAVDPDADLPHHTPEPDDPNEPYDLDLGPVPESEREDEEVPVTRMFVYIQPIHDNMQNGRRRRASADRWAEPYIGTRELDGPRDVRLWNDPAAYMTRASYNRMRRWIINRMSMADEDRARITFETLSYHPDFPAQHAEDLRVDGNDLVPYERPHVHHCSRCGASGWATLDNFAQRADGSWDTWCRQCHRDYSRTRRNLARYGPRFGVEIECNVPDPDSSYGDPIDSEVIQTYLEEAGIHCYNEGYTHQVYEDGWKIVSDASIVGWEIVSPPMYWKDRGQIDTVCRVLRDLGAVADASCGLHVHHEVSDLSLDQFKLMVRKWDEFQPLTNSLVSRNRRNGQWSSPLSAGEVNLIQRSTSLDRLRVDVGGCARYRSLNLTCFPTYGTVEFRQHQGTVNSRKILAWIAYGQGFIQACRDGSIEGHYLTSVDDFIEFLPLPDTERFDAVSYLQRRASVLAGSVATTIASSDWDPDEDGHDEEYSEDYSHEEY